MVRTPGIPGMAMITRKGRIARMLWMARHLRMGRIARTQRMARHLRMGRIARMLWMARRVGSSYLGMIPGMDGILTPANSAALSLHQQNQMHLQVMTDQPHILLPELM